MAMSKRSRAVTESLGLLAIIIGALVVTNFLGWSGLFNGLRADVTQNDLWSLSSGSKRLAKNLTDTLNITAYFSSDLPAPYNGHAKYVREILEEYENASGGKITVTFVEPESDEEKEEARADGIQAVAHQAIENDSVTVVEGYRGLVFHYLDKTETVPVVEDTSGLEYSITMKIKRMVGDTKVVGIYKGAGGPSLTKGLSRLQQCIPQYELKEVDAGDLQKGDLSALLMLEPSRPLGDEDLRKLNDFVMKGGSLGVFGGSMRIKTEGDPVATPVESGINGLLRPWGITVGDGLVHDALCGRAPLRTQAGFAVAVPHPPVPTVPFSDEQSEHPVAYKLSTAILPFTSPLLPTDAVSQDPDVKSTILANSSENSWNVMAESIELKPRDPSEWRQGSDVGPFPLLYAVEGNLPSAFAPISDDGGDKDAPSKATESARVLVAGGSFFLRDEAMPPPEQSGECQMSGSLAFALNAIDWLAQDQDLVAVRAKNVEEPVIEVPQDVQQAESTAREAMEEELSAEQQKAMANMEGNPIERAKVKADAEAKANEARAKQEAALQKHKEAMAAWEGRKDLYRWGNMVGIPALFALFGVIRWRMRTSRRHNLTL